MRHFTVALIAALSLTASQASTIFKPGKTTTTDGQVQTVTKGASVHANLPRIPRYKLFRSNPHKAVHRIVDGKYTEFIDDDGLITPYRRRDLTKVKHPEGVSDNISWRLFLARQLALQKHRSKFS